MLPAWLRKSSRNDVTITRSRGNRQAALAQTAHPVVAKK